MARLTRQSARSLASSSVSGTPTTNSSPIFSPADSVAVTESPLTSDQESTKKPAVRSRSNVKSKQKAQLDSEDLESDEADSKPATKRRVVSKEVYVEIPVRATRAKGKARVRLSHSTSSLIHIGE